MKIILAAVPTDFASVDLQELADRLSDVAPNLDVGLVEPQRVGRGVTWWEVLRVWLADPAATEARDATIKAIVAWLRKRFDKRATRPKWVILYGPDGAPLKHVKLPKGVSEPQLSDPEPGDLHHPPPPWDSRKQD